MAAWPVAAHAQQSERMRQVGVLMGAVANSPDGQSRIAAFQQGLQQLGWTEGRNVRIDTRWPAAGNADDIRRYAEELVALSPDVILATGSISIAPLLQTTRSVPIVFVQVVDPVGSGFVASLAQPGGNATGFTNFEYGLSAKWLELLKQIAPGVTRAAVLRDPTAAAGIGQFGAIQTAAPSLGVEVEQRGRGLEVFLKPGGPLDVCVSSSDGTRTAPRAGRGRATRRARASQRSVAATARSKEGVSGLLPCLLDYV